MILREVKIEDKDEILKIYQEYLSSEIIPGVDRFEGIRNLEHLSNLTFEEWINELEKNKDETKLNPNYSPQTTYVAIVDNDIVGLINIRWKPVSTLLNYGGFIGYGIRPSKRRMGYASKMLELALSLISKEQYEKVLITCKDFNIPSKKVIEKNNGKYENYYYDKNTEYTYLRYWIDIK